MRGIVRMLVDEVVNTEVVALEPEVQLVFKLSPAITAEQLYLESLRWNCFFCW